jgi:hypothetical protein
MSAMGLIGLGGIAKFEAGALVREHEDAHYWAVLIAVFFILGDIRCGALLRAAAPAGLWTRPDSLIGARR